MTGIEQVIRVIESMIESKPISELDEQMMVRLFKCAQRIHQRLKQAEQLCVYCKRPERRHRPSDGACFTGRAGFWSGTKKFTSEEMLRVQRNQGN